MTTDHVAYRAAVTRFQSLLAERSARPERVCVLSLIDELGITRANTRKDA